MLLCILEAVEVVLEGVRCALEGEKLRWRCWRYWIVCGVKDVRCMLKVLEVVNGVQHVCYE